MEVFLRRANWSPIISWSMWAHPGPKKDPPLHIAKAMAWGPSQWTKTNKDQQRPSLWKISFFFRKPPRNALNFFWKIVHIYPPYLSMVEKHRCSGLAHCTQRRLATWGEPSVNKKMGQKTDQLSHEMRIFLCSQEKGWNITNKDTGPRSLVLFSQS